MVVSKAQELGPVLLVDNFLSASRGNMSVGEELAARLQTAGWTVVTTSAEPGRVQKALDMVRTTWTKRGQYQCAHVSVYSGSAFVWAEGVCSVLRHLRKPYVLALHGGGLPQLAEHHPVRVSRLLATAAAVVAPSGYLGEKMQRYRPDLRLLPNAIELSAYPFRLRHSPYPRLVWLRSFHKLYNPCLAIRAVKCLRRDFADVQLTMVGNDKGDGTLEEARKLAYDLGVADHIDFPGRAEKSQVPQWLSRGDIFLNTSDVDNTPVSVIEAMACGLCIVSTRVGGVPYLLDHGTNALLIEPGDAEGLAAAVRRVIREPGLASQLSNGARRKAENFDWRVILPKWEGLFSSLHPLYSQQVTVRSGR